ncbi:carbonic anhydrase [Nitrospira sp. M1]
MQRGMLRAGITLGLGLTLLTGLNTSPTVHAMEALEAEARMEFGYESPDVTPDQWNTLAPLCGNGKEQSPVDLSQSKLTPRQERVRLRDQRNLKFSYHETPLEILNNGHTVEVEYEIGSTLRLAKFGSVFDVRQFHFHSPSEHSFEHGALFDVEIHIVHSRQDDPSQLAVVALLVKEGQENVALKPVFDHLDAVMNKGDHFVGAEEVNIADLLPKDQRYFGYMGSLTTPPCTEQVKWHVLRTPIELSREQINQLIAVFDNSCCPIHGNNRPTQSINARALVLDKNTFSDSNDEEDDD